MATCRASCLALFLLLAAPAPAQELRPPAQVGEAIPDFEFRQIVMYGDGRTRMSEYRWQPVLIEFWGTR